LHLLSLTQSGEPTFVKAAFHTPRSWAAFPDLCDHPDLPDCELGSSFWPLQACHLETIIWLCFKALTKITRIQNAVNFSSACAVRRTGGRAGPAPGNWPLGFIPKLRAERRLAAAFARAKIKRAWYRAEHRTISAGRTPARFPGARLCEPQGVACKTDVENGFAVTLPTARGGSQTRAPKYTPWISGPAPDAPPLFPPLIFLMTLLNRT